MHTCLVGVRSEYETSTLLIVSPSFLLSHIQSPIVSFPLVRVFTWPFSYSLSSAQFTVHVRRPGVIALQNVADPERWIAIYQGKTIGMVSHMMSSVPMTIPISSHATTFKCIIVKVTSAHLGNWMIYVGVGVVAIYLLHFHWHDFRATFVHKAFLFHWEPMHCFFAHTCDSYTSAGKGRPILWSCSRRSRWGLSYYSRHIKIFESGGL